MLKILAITFPKLKFSLRKSHSLTSLDRLYSSGLVLNPALLACADFKSSLPINPVSMSNLRSIIEPLVALSVSSTYNSVEALRSYIAHAQTFSDSEAVTPSEILMSWDPMPISDERYGYCVHINDRFLSSVKSEFGIDGVSASQVRIMDGFEGLMSHGVVVFGCEDGVVMVELLKSTPIQLVPYGEATNIDISKTHLSFQISSDVKLIRSTICHKGSDKSRLSYLEGDSNSSAAIARTLLLGAGEYYDKTYVIQGEANNSALRLDLVNKELVVRSNTLAETVLDLNCTSELFVALQTLPDTYWSDFSLTKSVIIEDLTFVLDNISVIDDLFSWFYNFSCDSNVEDSHVQAVSECVEDIDYSRPGLNKYDLKRLRSDIRKLFKLHPLEAASGNRKGQSRSIPAKDMDEAYDDSIMSIFDN